MRASKTYAIGLGLAVCLLPKTALAHLVNTDVGEFYAGMLHPLTSVDHLLPLLGLALLAGQCSKAAGRWTMLVFPLALMVSVLVGRNFQPLGLVHIANLVMLVALGGLLAMADKVQTKWVAALAGLVGLILGFRSGADMAIADVGLQFIPGAGLTGFMVIALIAAWVPKAASRIRKTARAIAGACLAVAGLYLLVEMLLGGDGSAARSIGMPDEESLTGLLKAEKLTWPVVLAAFVGAAGWGAAHALTPGHGKAIVGAYLVGAHSTPWHAVFLGLTVTATHTLGIFALGLVTLFASEYLVAEDLYPWMGAVSGLLVAAIGLSLLIRRWKTWRTDEAGSGHHHDHHDHDHNHHHRDHDHDHDHDHGHSHLPPGTDGAAVTWRSLLGLGISGGLLPCPSALVLLLTAVSLNRTGLGLALVVAFSLGLAAVLTAVGLLFVKGGRLIERIPKAKAITRLVPVLSSGAIAIIGALITWQSLAQISF